jgi:Protein of unknown function (DUF2959)
MTRLAALLVCSGLLAGCQTAYFAALEKVGFAKRDILSSRVKSARDTQESAKKEIQNALAEFGKVVNYQGGELEVQYKRLSLNLDRSNDAADSVRKRIADVQSVGDALFSEWRGELAQYSNPDLRRASEAQLQATRLRYDEMMGAMKRAESRLDPALRPLRDQVLFLKHNLNARALSGIKGEVSKVDSEVTRLVEEINRSISEANRFIQDLEKNPA